MGSMTSVVQSNNRQAASQHRNNPQRPTAPPAHPGSYFAGGYGVQPAPPYQVTPTVMMPQPGQVTYSTDTSKDLILSRILAALEFLGRMDETDETIKTMRSVSEPDEHLYKRIVELLGLRGHLQDELLRIQSMLAEGDPQLRKLDEFEPDYSRVVKHLRELAIAYETADLNNYPEMQEIVLETNTNFCDTVNEARGNHQSTQSEAEAGSSRGDRNTQTEGMTLLTEDELRQKHDQEEVTIAKKYGLELMAKREELSKEEMEAFSGEHLRIMQALRKKQNGEKAQLQEHLRQKLAARKAKKEAGDAEEVMEAKVTDTQRLETLIAESDDINSNHSSRSPRGHSAAETSTSLQQNKASTSTETDRYMLSTGTGVDGAGTTSSGVNTVPVVTAASGTNTTDSTSRSSNSPGRTSNDASNSLSDDEEVEIFQSGLDSQIDEVAAQILKNKRNISEEALEELMLRLKHQQEAVKGIHKAEKGQHNEALQAKLVAMRNGKGGRDAGVEELYEELQRLHDEGNLTEASLRDLIRKYLGLNKPVPKSRSPRPPVNQDEDAQKIVEEHQKKTKQINNMRQREKNALDAKLKKKLHVERA